LIKNVVKNSYELQKSKNVKQNPMKIDICLICRFCEGFTYRFVVKV